LQQQAENCYFYYRMGLSRSSLNYWHKRVRKNKFSRGNGKSYANPEYEILLSIDGKQHRFNLTSNKEVSAEKALGIWYFYKANGGQATLNKYKDDSVKSHGNPTVGEFLAAIEKQNAIAPRTFAIYSRKFRRLVSAVAKIKSDDSKHNYVGEGYKNWKGKVEAVKLSQLRPSKIREWRTN